MALNKYRKIYERHYGEIPSGYHIHHKDHNHYNNDPENLVAIPSGKHYKYHTDNRLIGKEYEQWKEVVTQQKIKSGAAQAVFFNSDEMSRLEREALVSGWTRSKIIKTAVSYFLKSRKWKKEKEK